MASADVRLFVGALLAIAIGVADRAANLGLFGQAGDVALITGGLSVMGTHAAIGVKSD